MSDEDPVRDELDEAIELSSMTEIEQLLDRASNHVTNARAMPMSASVMNLRRPCCIG